MKPLLLNTFDLDGGAARAAYRLHRGLLELGVEARLMVQQKSSDDPRVLGPTFKGAPILGQLRSAADYFPARRYGKRRNKEVFSPAYLPGNLPNAVRELKPDVVHLHWVAGGFVNVEALKRLSVPLVWTMHDMWTFTGGCHYDQNCRRFTASCGRCPMLGSKKDYDLSRRIWRRKQKAWSNLNLTLVSPSKWLADQARASSLFNDARVLVIPNGLDLGKYRPFSKQFAREAFGLPRDKKLILFGAMNSTSDSRKGFQHLRSALQSVAQQGWADQAELVIFGASRPEAPPDLGLKQHYMGRLHDDTSMALLYSAADVFVAPSEQENLSNAVMEALACGTPGVAFDIGGMPDMIRHQKTGYLAQPFEAEDLAKGVAWLLNDENLRQQISLQARSFVESNFELSLIARRYRDLYLQVREKQEVEP